MSARAFASSTLPAATSSEPAFSWASASFGSRSAARTDSASAPGAVPLPQVGFGELQARRREHRVLLDRVAVLQDGGVQVALLELRVPAVQVALGAPRAANDGGKNGRAGEQSNPA